MPVVEKSVLIDYTAEQMFDLVDRVEDYPQFLPWCANAVVHARTDTLTSATILIGLHGLNTSFSTDNVKTAPFSMEMRLREGPFRRLSGIWRFTPLGDAGCKVGLRLEYEFSGALLERALGAVFDHVTGSMVDSFVKRAEQVYG